MLDTLKKLYELFDHQDKKMFLLLLLLLFISGVLSLVGIGAVIPFVTVLLAPDKNWLTSFFVNHRKEDILLYSVLAMIAAFWIKNIASYYCLRIQNKVLYDIAYKISRKLYKVYMQSPYVWHLSQNSPELIRNVINECYVLAHGVLSPLGAFATEIVTALLVFGFLLYMNVKFTLIVSSALIICMVLLIRIQRNRVDFYAKKRAITWAAMTKDVIQGIGGIKETKIYQLDEFFINNFNKNTYDAAESIAFSSVSSQSSRFVLEAAVVTVVMLAVSIFSRHNHNNTQIFLLLTIFGVSAMQLLPSLNRLLTAYSSLKFSLPALNVINDAFRYNHKFHSVMLNINEVDEKSIVFKNELGIENLSYSYPDGSKAIVDISLKIKKGQSVAFVGYSGSGKTTLADIILGLLNPTSGRILIDSVELNNHNLKKWQQQLGYIPQMIYSYDSSIKENVAFGVDPEKIDEDQVWHALEMASLSEFVRSLDNGLNTQIGENGVRISGGQRQRVGIARALFRNPDVLIMDEATAALDNQTEKEVTQAIQKAALNRTVITIAHRLSTVKFCDVIYVMDQGKITAAGTYDELLNTSDLFNRLAKIEAVA